MLALKSSVEQKTEQLCQSNAFLVGAQKGQLSTAQIRGYLGGLRYLFDAFQRSLMMAAEISTERGEHELAVFFKGKYKEEDGHSTWADNDMRHFQVNADANEKAALDQAKRLESFLHDLIKNEPKFFLPFMYTLEYFTVLAGPVILDSLREKQGIESTKLSAVANHVKSDTPHVEEDLREIAKWVSDERVMKQFVEVIHSTMEQVDRYLGACTSTVN
jgi:hypothetical protein